MDEFFTHKCVTSDAPAPQSPTNSSSSNGVSTWSQSARCEFVVVQENQQAHGASRAVLASIVNMVALRVLAIQWIDATALFLVLCVY